MTRRRLILLRHAKSSWADPLLEDIDRPLNKRGHRAAVVMARYFKAEGLVPGLVLCSPAKRTRMTLDALLPGWPDTVPVLFDERLYEASGRRLLSVLQEAAPAQSSLLLIGHNPGVQDLALALLGKARDPESESLREKFPTGALAELTATAADWPAAKPGTFQLARFIRPRDLADPGD